MQPFMKHEVIVTNVIEMKKLVVIFLLFVSCMVMAQETVTRKVGSFKGIKVSEGIDVYLKKGDKESIRLEVSGIDPERVITEVSGDYLKIHLEDGNYKNKTVKAYVTYVSLERLSASSAASIFAEGVIKARLLYLNASSAGSIDIQIEVDELDAGASSAGEIALKGTAARASLDASSAGEVAAYDLSAGKVDARASSGGSIKVTANESLEAHASSGGDVRYRGNPSKSNTNSSSGGSVKRSN